MGCAPPGNIIVRILNNPNLLLTLELVLLNVAGSDVLKAVDLKNSAQASFPIHHGYAKSMFSDVNM